MADLAVIIVTWNGRDLTLNALRSLFTDLKQTGPAAVVYVVDNASSDDTAAAVQAEFPQVKLIALAENIGFAAGNNAALRQIGFGGFETGDLPRAVYLLNSDTITQPGATRALYDHLMSDARIGLVGARLAYGDGTFQDSAFGFPGLRQLWVEFFPTPGRLIEGSFNGRYPMALYEAGQPFKVDCVLGATMMLRREVIEATGMFDEQFFMYCEEIDWAWRMHKADWEIHCVPSARVIHLAGQSTNQVRVQSLIHLWTSRLRLFGKHYSPLKLSIARLMTAAGMRLKTRQAEHAAHLSPPERTALVGAYQIIYNMAVKSR